MDGSKSWAVGGAYDFKVVKVYANYIQEKFDGAAPFDTSKDGKKHKLWSAGVSVPVSAAGTLRAEYMEFKADELRTIRPRASVLVMTTICPSGLGSIRLSPTSRMTTMGQAGRMARPTVITSVTIAPTSRSVSVTRSNLTNS